MHLSLKLYVVPASTMGYHEAPGKTYNRNTSAFKTVKISFINLVA